MRTVWTIASRGVTLGLSPPGGTTMQVHLTAEMETFLQSLIERGRFYTVDDAILDALALLKDQEALVEIRRAEIKKLIDEGTKDIEEGRVGPLDMGAIMVRVNSRLSSVPGFSQGLIK